MIVVMQEQAPEEAVAAATLYLVQAGCRVQRCPDPHGCVLSVDGELSATDTAVVRDLPGVAQVVAVRDPFRLASKRLRSEPTVLQGDYGTIGGPQPWIAIEPIGLSAGAKEEEAAPTSASLPYRIAAGRSFDAAITRNPVAPDNVGALSCLSIHPSPRDARSPVLFVTRQPSWGVDTWLERAEHELQRGGSEVVLLEAGCEYPTGERTFDVGTVLRTKSRTHLPIVVDVPTIAQRVRFVKAMACAAIGMGVDGVILRVFTGPSTEQPRAPATLRWDDAVQLAGWLRSTASTTRQ